MSVTSRTKAGESALVLIDFLEDYFDPSLWPKSELPGVRDELTSKTRQLISACRRAGIRVVWIRQAFRADLSDAFPHMRKSGKRYTIAGTPGANVLSELDWRPEDINVFKTRYSAFFKTDLLETLEQLKIRHLILAGVTTAWCVRSTAVDAIQHGFDVTLVQDCMAAFTLRDHEESIRAMDGYLGPVIRAADLDVYFGG